MKVIVTGGSRGIGLAIVNAFKAAGHEVDSLSRTEGVNLLDMNDWSEVDFDCDILVNNVATQYTEPADEYAHLMDDLDWVGIAMSLSQAAYPYMKSRGWGRIINISSVAAVCGGRYVIGYGMAKAALNRLTKGLAVEWAKDGITINAIMPGITVTDMTKGLQDDPAHLEQMLGRIPAGRLGTPEDTAALALFLASDAASYINGACIPVDGGWLAR